MANVSSVGIGSGVLTSDLIDKLVAAEREPTELRLDAKEESITTELSVFGQIQSAVTDFRLASRPLADPSLFNSLSISSSNSAVSGSVSDGAQAGSYTLEVTALAKAQSLSSAIFADSDTTAVGTGTLDITIGATTTSIDIDASNNTLDGLAAAINAEEDLGASASVINVGSGYRLVITADETGLDNTIEIAVTDTGDASNIDTNGLSQLSYTSGAFNLNENQAADDAAFELNGLAISRSTNTFSDVISGVTLTLSGTNAGSPAVLDISRNTDSVVEKVEEFVDAFNVLQEIISENTEFNADNPAASGLLLGDSSTRTIINQIQGIIGQSIEGLGSASVRSVSEIGISTNKDTGQLEFDSAVLLSKLASDAESVAGIFADQGRTTDNQVEFVRAGLGTKVGTYDINISQIAAKGAYQGTVSLGASTTIDTNNDEIRLKIDGTSTGTITLDAGSYTPAQLATELQEKINADSNLIAAGKSVTVSVDGSDQLVISSSEFGSASSVSIESLDTTTQATFGFRRDYLGNVELGASTTIDSDNNTLSLTVDGVASNEITLTAGAYTAADLATEIQNQINADTAISGAGLSVTVSLDASDRLIIRSDDASVNGYVSFDAVDTNMLAELGIGLGTGNAGLDVAGTINGAAATGQGQYLTAADDDDSESIRLLISGGSTGDRGTVSYIEGVGEQMVDLINSFLGANGVITAKNERLNAALAEISQERVSLEQRITSLNERLVRQFTAADIIIAQLNSTQDFIAQQLEAIVASNKKD